MNVDLSPDRSIGPAVWERREMRVALACRDLATVYRLLQRSGVSQRRIAALTGQSSSEVYEILNGRQVMAYDVLVRIAEGLGVPRGYLGLAYDESTGLAVDLVASACSPRQDEREEVRQLLAHAAEVTIGASVDEVSKWWQPVECAATPVPQHVGLCDVVQIEDITRVMRALDYRHGGGVCRDAVVAQASWAQQLLTVDHAEDVGRRLHLALADLHNLAGWTSFDVGLVSPARRHFARALAQARHAGDASLVANVLYRMGRLHLHCGLHHDALKFFQLGQLAAQESGCELTVAMLCANEAWAYALLGDEQQALKSIGRAQDEFARADRSTARAWVGFFGLADLHALTGMVCLALPASQSAGLDRAVESFTRSLAARESDMTRSRTFELTALATAHLRSGSLTEGITAGHEAVDLAGQVRSIRAVDRLAPLEVAARQHPKHADAQDLAGRVAALRAA